MIGVWNAILLYKIVIIQNDIATSACFNIIRDRIDEEYLTKQNLIKQQYLPLIKIPSFRIPYLRPE